MKKFMLDIETTGLSPINDEILQISILEMNWADVAPGWIPGELMNFVLPCARHPESDFAKKYQMDLYATCNKLAESPKPAHEFAREIKDWLNSRNDNGEKPELVGWNIAGFDVQFLKQKNVLTEADFFYRLYDVQSVIHAVHGLCDPAVHRREIEAFVMSRDTLVTMPEGQAHNAVYDVYRQTKILNGCLVVMNEGVVQSYRAWLAKHA